MFSLADKSVRENKSESNGSEQVSQDGTGLSNVTLSYPSIPKQKYFHNNEPL